MAEGLGWRELAPAPPDDDGPPFRPGLTTRRWLEVPSLTDGVWEAAVAKAQAVYRRTGIRGGTDAAPDWTAGRGRRRVRMEGERWGLGGRVAVEHTRPAGRPWLMAVALLCWPTAAVGTVVLLSRPTGLLDWAPVGGLLAVPVGVFAVIAAAEWLETGLAVWRARRVLRAVRKASRPATTVWVAAAEVEDLEALEASDPDPARLPKYLAASEWLSPEEMDGLDGETAAPAPEAALVWPVEVAPDAAAPTPAPPAFRDVPFAETYPLPTDGGRSRGDGAVRPRGDGVTAHGNGLPALDVLHLRELEAVPEPVGGDGRAGPAPELGVGRRTAPLAEPRPPEARAGSLVWPTPPEPAGDVFTEWHPRPPWAWR